MKSQLNYLSIMLALLALSTLNPQFSTAFAQGTAFTYQGRLNSGSVPANGNYDVVFALYNDPLLGSQVGFALTNSAVPVTNGLFTTTIDFGGAPWTGQLLFLQILVRTNGNGALTLLSPRQELTPTPYAIYSATAGNAATANTAGSATSANTATSATSAATATTANNFSGSLAGDVTGTQGATVVSSVGGQSAANVAGGANAANAATSADTANTIVKRDGSGNFSAGTITANLAGNADTATTAASANSVAAANITGTIASANLPNGLGGSGNTASGGDATAVGGFNNTASGSYAFAAGHDAQATNQGAFVWADTQFATFSSTNNDSFNVRAQGGARFVTGGAGMTVDGQQVLTTGSSIPASQLPNGLGGNNNTVTGDYSTVAGGSANQATNIYSTVDGGLLNNASGSGAFIGGGGWNQGPLTGNTASGQDSVVVGGIRNTASGFGAFIGGGDDDGTTLAGNTASGNASVVTGGFGNQATNTEATVPGGAYNIAGGQYSFAAGQQAQALNDGAFVWADASSSSPFASTATNQFLIRASGGVGIGTTTPAAGLDVEYSPAGVNHGSWGYLQQPVYTAGPFGGSPNLAIYTSGAMGASTYYAFSDARIKNVIGVSAGAEDLKPLRAIEVTDYTYKDPVANGSRQVKKVIAQQVETVYPQAVSQTTGVVPDIFQAATQHDGWVKLSTNLKVGERVKLVSENGQGIYPVLETRDGAFRTDFKPATEKVFVYGREVNDFRNVDYEALTTLNVSATQELARKLDAQQAALNKLQDQLNQTLAEKDTLLKHLAALEARDEAREDRLARIERDLEKGSAARLADKSARAFALNTQPQEAK